VSVLFCSYLLSDLQQCFLFVEHGYFRPAKDVTDDSLMDAVIEVVSKCSDEFDEGVQLQVYLFVDNGMGFPS
jgi:hypothetical protein